jgi:two-component system response regulator YesN
VNQMKICVVEDEKGVREGIIQKLNQLDKNIQVFDIGFGYSALEKVKAIRPDLVLTDIMMPEIDGLEMLRLVKTELPLVQVVLLSGYDEFEYARQAVQLGAMDYLLKPVDRIQLKEVLEKVEQGMKKVLQSEMETHLVELSHHQIFLEDIEYLSPSIWFDNRVPKGVSFQNNAEDSKNERDVVLKFSVNRDFCGAIICQNVRKSNVFYSGEDFTKIFFQKLKDWESECFFVQQDRSSGVKSKKSDNRKSTQLRQRIMSAAKSLNDSKVDTYLNEWLVFVESYPLYELRKECVFLLASLDEGMSTNNNDIHVIDEEKIHYWTYWINQFKTWSSLKENMYRFILNGIRAMKNIRQSEPAQLVDRVKYVLSSSNHAQLNLESVAEELDIHPVTLSRLFKDHTGTNFVQYLVQHKMQYAKKLLVESNKKIKEIANEVGYTDHRYFSLVFKRTFSCSPSEFRKINNLKI